jgi:hypothetical protein
VLLIITMSAARLFGQTPDTVLTFKANGYRQTSATGQQIYEPGYAVEVTFPTAPTTTTKVQLVGMGVTLNIPRVTLDTFYLQQDFADEATLNRVLPDGDYTLVASGGGTTSRTAVTITMGSSGKPPLITNFDALQSWDGSPFRITWQPIAGATADDHLVVTVSRADGTTAYESPTLTEPNTLDGTATATAQISITATPGESLSGVLEYMVFNPTLANNGNTIVVAGHGFFLEFPIARQPLIKPVINRQPRVQTVAAGTTVAFSVGATGTDATYQWRLNGSPISGATSANYIVTSASATTAGFYTVDVANGAGSVTSVPATLTLATTASTAQITNLAIRSQAGTADRTLIVGFSTAGSSTVQKPILMRGAGPALTPFGVTGAMSDPKITLFSSTGVKLDENDNWGGATQLKTIAAQVGAFGFADTSNDAALYRSLDTGGYSLQVTGANNSANGVAIAEIYDASPAATSATARLINVSARTQVGTNGDVLIAGFVIGGTGAKTLLIRAVGPTLGQFGVSGTLLDPQLTVFTGAGDKIDENDNWGGSSALSSIFSRVGAFGLSSTTKDSAVVVTLNPGAYTAQVSGVGNTTGIALVEVYEVP